MQLRLHGSPDHRYERQIVVLDSQIAPDVGHIEGAHCNDGFEVVKDAVATAQDLDIAVRFGFGFRYLAAGPMLQRDHAGLDVHCAAAATMYPTLCNASEPSQVLKNHVAQGRWGMKTGGGFFDWPEDRRLAEQARYKHRLQQVLALLANELPPVDGAASTDDTPTA